MERFALDEHILRSVDRFVDIESVRARLKPFYSETGRPSVCPKLMIRMLPTKLIWFAFGVAMTGLSFTGVWLTYRRMKKTLISRTQIATMPVLLGAMIFGSFYLDRYLGEEENSVLVADAGEEFGDLSVQSVWRKGIDSGQHLMEVSIRHKEGRPLVRSVRVVGADKEAHELRFRTFAANTVLKGALPASMAHDGSVTIEIEMASGELMTTIMDSP